MTDVRTATIADPIVSRIQWGPVIAGSIIAAAVATVLHGFATGIGISVSSTAPTWRDASFALILLTGLYLLVVGILAYGLGAYVAGRLRSRLGTLPDLAYSDGMHGLIVWGLSTLMTALLAGIIALGAARLAAPSGGSAGPAVSVAGENIIAFDLDRLFRGRQVQGDVDQIRAEAARILLSDSSHRGMLDEDRAYLIRLVSGVTGISQGDAERRVNDVRARAREDISRARRSAAILAFMAAAVAMLGAAVAWYMASWAGAHREGLEPLPGYLDWDKPWRRTETRTLP
jgi:hypothetical protein